MDMLYEYPLCNYDYLKALCEALSQSGMFVQSRARDSDEAISNRMMQLNRPRSHKFAIARFATEKMILSISKFIH